MGKIRVDIDELLDKLHAVNEDGFTTVELEINSDEYGCSELAINAIGVEIEEPVSYGSLTEVDDEL